MNIEELRKKIQDSSDKVNVLRDKEIINSCEGLTYGNFFTVINDLFSDEQKAELLKLEYFSNFEARFRARIVDSIENSDIACRLINDENVMKDVSSYQVINLIKKQDNAHRLAFVKDAEKLKSFDISRYDIKEIIESLDDSSKTSILQDEQYLTKEIGLTEFDISKIITGLENDESKMNMAKKYNLESSCLADVVCSLKDEKKNQILLDSEYEFSVWDTCRIIGSQEKENIVQFLNNNKEFLEQNNIEFRKVLGYIDKEKALDIIQNIDRLDFDVKEKKRAIATLDDELKKQLEDTDLPAEYKDLLKIRTGNQGIEVDFEGNMERYKDLDELLYINPLLLSETQKASLNELIRVCPDIKIKDNLVIGESRANEYLEGEKWIDSVINSLDENWSDIEKVAYIDNAIGKRISYTPDFGTEEFDANGARALWKIISSGYGVCNGIAQVEKYILDKVGIESEQISSGSHAFLKLVNIELPTAAGENIKGDTILDPTWNLAAQRFGGKPNNFCKSYEEIRKNDIDLEGKDHNCHRVEGMETGTTISLDETSLRNIYKSIGIADINGDFPIKKIMEKSKGIYDRGLSDKECISKQFEIVREVCPEFATCQNSTMEMLRSVIDVEKLGLDKCVVDRVYNMSDESKEPVTYMYTKYEDGTKTFYYADKQTGEFSEISLEEFEKTFECYETDLDKNKGKRPWEIEEVIEEEIDLSRDSGKIEASKELREDR